MLQRVNIALHGHITDTIGKKFANSIQENLGITVRSVTLIHIYTLEGFSPENIQTLISQSALHDLVVQQASTTAFPLTANLDADWILEVGFRPGVTDNEARTANETARLVLHLPKEHKTAVYTAKQYRITCTDTPLTKADIEHIAKDLLANELIQRFSIKSNNEWNKEPDFPAVAPAVTGKPNDTVETIPFLTMDEAAMLAFSKANTLALNANELTTIQAYYKLPQVIETRKKNNLPENPTDAEIEVLAQTWSEHCKHKIFAAKIDYENKETGEKECIDSIFKTYIQGSTATIKQNLGEKDFCRSIFKDNAGVIAFDQENDICIKVETHNSPSALDPYGGALTGIVGVNRDPMGTGMGAELLCNTNVFCFASPFHTEALPPRLLHPRRVMEGVRLGVEDGGNKSGVPTVNGSFVFDERFLGKPLVFCGTVGIMPAMLHGKPGWQKQALIGDAIVMVGGRIGKDGIHGATFSSEELHEDSPATAVQIGDPITQRKAYDFIIKARNAGLYNAITDNGAGGLSSSIGEMAQDTNGCIINLAKAPLKYDGLRPWEILLSEAQERMTLAVPQNKLESFLNLAAEMDVEASALGTFTDSGYFHAFFNEKPVAMLEMDFLHDGVPQLELTAVWEAPKEKELSIDLTPAEHTDTLLNLLASLNICSKEYAIRQYDHEVKGGSVVKPLVGVNCDAPADAAVLRPVLSSNKGIVLSHGICPKFSDYDTYWMMANAIDEAIRNAVAVGANPQHMAGIDNFCWCDPVQSEKTPDGHYKLAQLVRANKALADFCIAFGVPCISGKDSMKNDYTGGGVKISIPPTVLFSAMGIIDSVEHALTSDSKHAGDVVYILGNTAAEMAGSELATLLGKTGGAVPQVDAQTALQRYCTVYAAAQQQLINACHDCSDGGLAVALAEMAIGGCLGLNIDLSMLPAVGTLTPTEALYSESASRLVVTVPQDKTDAFEALFSGQAFARIGVVTQEPRMVVNQQGSQQVLINTSVEKLTQAFKQTLAW